MLQLNTRAATRGNKFKLENYSFHCDVRKYSFCPHIVNIWNSLPDYNVVDTDNLDKLKARIDKFGSTKRFHSIVNQNCPEPETNHRFRYRGV